MARIFNRGPCIKILGLATTLSFLLAGCAATEGGHNLPPPIPEGKGHLILEAGGINQLNWFVIDQETEEQVFADTPRPASTSPSAFERSITENRLHTYLDPGIYTIVVNTDLSRDSIEIPDVEVVLGEEKWVPIQVGRFMLNVTRSGIPTQVRFLIFDYQMRSVLGEGMTSTQVRHFIVRPGIYKVRIAMLSAEIDHIRDVEVSMGRVTPIFIELEPDVGEEEPGDQDLGP